MLVRPRVDAGEVTERNVMPGDVLGGGENTAAGALATVGAGTWTGAQIATGIIARSGSTAAYTDTTDTAVNILTALKGNSPSADIVSGTSFRLLVQNTVAFALTLAAGVGVTLGTGTTTIAASLVREYLVTVLNADGPYTLPCGTTNGNKIITFNLPPGAVALPIGPSPLAVNITAGMVVSGAGIAAGTKVLGVTQGVGGITGVTTDTNSTATNVTSALTFGPSITIDGLRSSTL